MARRKGALVPFGMLAAAFAGGAFAQWLAGGCTMLEARAAAQEKAVRAEQFIVVDAQGREVGALAAVPEGVGLTVRGPDGKERISLAADSGGGAGLSLNDAEGRQRIGLGYNADGGGLFLLDPDGVSRVDVGISPTGDEGGLSLNKADGKPRASLGMGGASVGLSMRNNEGTEIVGIGVGQGGGGDLTLRHPSDGHVVWQASRQAPPREE
jgi:hypothetical protein